MAKKGGGAKAGRNKVKCAEYRQRKGGEGSKRPKQKGSNQTIATIDTSGIDRVPYRNRSLGPKITVTISDPDTGQKIVTKVPESWVAV